MSGRVVLDYESPQPIYGIAFSSAEQQRIALTTLITGPSNKLSIIELDPSFASSSSSRYPNTPSRSSYHDEYNPNHIDTANAYRQIAQVNLPFPASKVAFEPASYAASAGAVGASGYGHGQGEERGGLVATSGDVLRIWDLQRDWSGSGNGQGGMGNGGFVGRNGYAGQSGHQEGGGEWKLDSRSVLANNKTPSLSLPPITSFAWNSIAPERIVSCSIDTTATLWDIETTKAVTQLIAHDRAVYDLSWLPDSSDIFVSVGADGSLRAFDLRQLEHSTILYESVNETPLARIAFSNREQYIVACFGTDDSKVLILDMRSPGQPVAELVGHQGPLSAIAWGSGGENGAASSGGGWIASCGDDGQLLMYDLVTPLPESRPPSTAPSNGASGSKSGRTSSKSRSGTQTQNNLGLAPRGQSITASPSPYPHSFNPRTGISPCLSSSGQVGGTNQTGRLRETPIDPLMLGVSSGTAGAGAGVGTPSAGGGSGRTPSPSAASTGTGRESVMGNGADGGGGGAGAGGGGTAISIMPARGWSAGREISNLAFDKDGEWVGCVAGTRLSVLKV